MTRYAAVVLAGGRAVRLGGAAKPELPVAGRAMRDRVLAAVPDADPRIVVGPAPPRPLPRVLLTREDPPGSGPAAATVAGLRLVPPGVTYVALLAADLPFLTQDAVRVLRRAASDPGCDGALFVDGQERPQWLCGVWRTAALRDAADRLDTAAGASLRRLLGDLRGARVPAGTMMTDRSHPPPWYDCDTEADLRRAEKLARRLPAGNGDRVPVEDER